MNKLRLFFQSEDGVAVVEIVLILIVLIALVLIFKDRITDVLRSLMAKVSTQSSQI